MVDQTPTLGRGNPEAWHLRLTVEPFFTTRLPGEDEDNDDDDEGDDDGVYRQLVSLKLTTSSSNLQLHR